MAVFYLLGIKIFHVLIIVGSIFNPKAKLWLSGRKNIFRNLKNQIYTGEKLAWFHCASLGEFEQGRPVIESFKEKHPEYKILLTFFSPSGYEVRKNYENADYVFYLPLDTPLNAKRFLDIVNPSIVFFIKYEFWYYFIKEIHKRKVPLYLVSGIFRKNQRFFKWYSYKSRRMLSYFTHFFVQNEESEKLLYSIDLNNVTVTGDTRFDRVYTIAQSTKNLPLVEKFKRNDLILIAGSTWKPDEEILFKWFNESQYPIKLIIAPHEIHPENISRIIKLVSSKYSILKYSEANEDNMEHADVLIINSIGLLSSLYKYGNIAYIGGGFGKGIHNTLEAATFGMPVLFGPNYRKFQEAVDLINLGGAFSVQEYSELKKRLDDLLNNPVQVERAGKIASKYVEKQRGATGTILHLIDIE